MNKHRLQAELWETQIILYWILAFLIARFSPEHIWAAYAILVWTVISVIGTFALLLKAQKEDKNGLS